MASKPALLDSESHDAKIGIEFLGSHWNQNQLLLELESWILVNLKSESKFCELEFRLV